jgi:hypothetical protein
MPGGLCGKERFKKNEQGTFTLEASLIFPAIFICTLLLLFTSLFIFQKVYLSYVTLSASERLAYVWDNSHKEPFSGEFDPYHRDGLYWRWQEGSLLSLLHGQPNPFSVTTDQGQASNLPEQKLSRLNEHIPQGITGELQLVNGWLEKKVNARLEQKYRLPLRLAELLGNESVREATAIIVDPVEYIRHLQLIQHYGAQFLQQGRVQQIFDQYRSQ